MHCVDTRRAPHVRAGIGEMLCSGVDGLAHGPSAEMARRGLVTNGGVGCVCVEPAITGLASQCCFPRVAAPHSAPRESDRPTSGDRVETRHLVFPPHAGHDWRSFWRLASRNRAAQHSQEQGLSPHGPPRVPFLVRTLLFVA
jgi:hypothetical protein